MSYQTFKKKYDLEIDEIIPKNYNLFAKSAAKIIWKESYLQKQLVSAYY